MQQEQTNKNHSHLSDEINLQELFYVLLQGRWIIISITALASIIGVIYSLLLPNIYESKALLVPINSSSSISGSLGGYSNLAGLAGINLASSNEGNSVKAIKKISSLSFFENNILSHIYLQDLVAVKSWDSNTNKLIYDESIYKIIDNTWHQKPSIQDGFKSFIGEHLSLSEDINTRFITLSIKHQSPYVAKQWADLVFNEVNSFYRQKDKAESERAVSYLNKQISTTDLSEIKQVLAQLLQEETKKLTLIEANKSYVFDYIDPPAVMEKKSEPKRSLICILAALAGGFLSVLVVLMKHYFFRIKLTSQK
jgi:LPS O-antigen subunit length determinant protein (WzzB/FepE family)